MKVAYYSPLPPDRTGVADYSALLLPALSSRMNVEVVRRGQRRPPRGTDISLYHIGNNPEMHGWIVEALRRWPGVVVLHEFVLHHLIAGLTLGKRDTRTYLDAMEREGGLAARLLGHGVIEGSVPPLWENRPEDFPLAGLVLDATRDKGVIVHSRYAEELTREAGYKGPLWRIPHPAWPRPELRSAEIAGSPLIGVLGNLNASKRIPQVLEAFARLRDSFPAARLLLVGEAAARFDLTGRLERLGLADDAAVHREEFVDEERFWSLMAACDVCVSLRAPTMGETSGSVIRALSLGKPLVVSDSGWFGELPDEVALKVPVDEREIDVLAGTLELLAKRDDMRAAMSAAAELLARSEHDLGRVAELYASALEQAAGSEAVRDAVVAEVSAAAAEVGIAAESPEAARIGKALREAGLGD